MNNPDSLPVETVPLGEILQLAPPVYGSWNETYQQLLSSPVDARILSAIIEDYKKVGKIRTPIRCDRDEWRVVDGTHRVIAAKELGLTSLPVLWDAPEFDDDVPVTELVLSLNHASWTDVFTTHVRETLIADGETPHDPVTVHDVVAYLTTRLMTVWTVGGNWYTFDFIVSNKSTVSLFLEHDTYPANTHQNVATDILDALNGEGLTNVTYTFRLCDG